jgi:hypothetical protein
MTKEDNVTEWKKLVASTPNSAILLPHWEAERDLRDVLGVAIKERIRDPGRDRSTITHLELIETGAHSLPSASGRRR